MRKIDNTQPWSLPTTTYASIGAARATEKDRGTHTRRQQPNSTQQRGSKQPYRRVRALRPKTNIKRLSPDHRFILKLFLTICFIFFAIFFFQRFFELWSYHYKSIPTDVAAQLIDEIPSAPSLASQLLAHTNARLAGTPQALDVAKQTKQTWQRSLPHVDMTPTTMELNWPLLQQLDVIDGSNVFQRRWTYDNSKPMATDIPTIPFHAFSADGNVTGHVVDVGAGLAHDYARLETKGLRFTETIALIRYDAQQPMLAGYQVTLAQRHGCVGALLYADPRENNQKNGPDTPHDAYPVGPWRAPASKAFASVMDLATGIHVPADMPLAPENPENASKEENALPTIPSLPISWNDAQFLMSRANSSSDHAVSNVAVRLVNVNQRAPRTLHHITARIPGQQDIDKAVIIGCQRDALETSGVVESASSSAIMDELVRTLGVLMKKGWRPRRTIVLASWDAAAYGQVGPAAWVHANQAWLYKDAIAYVDIGSVAGELFDAQGSPLLQRLLFDQCQDLFDHDQGQSLYDLWKKSASMQGRPLDSLLRPIALDNPGIAFFYKLGIPSLSMRFTSNHFGVAHTNDDNLDWTYRFGDSKLVYHRMLVKLSALVALHLSSDPVLPLFPLEYADRMVDAIQQRMQAAHADDAPAWTPLRDALYTLQITSTKFDRKMTKAQDAFDQRKHYSKKLQRQAVQINTAVAQFERTFLDAMGLPDRTWYKHAVYGPDAENPAQIVTFPALDATNATSSAVEQRITALIVTATDLIS